MYTVQHTGILFRFAVGNVNRLEGYSAKGGGRPGGAGDKRMRLGRRLEHLGNHHPGLPVRNLEFRRNDLRRNPRIQARPRVGGHEKVRVEGIGQSMVMVGRVRTFAMVVVMGMGVVGMRSGFMMRLRLWVSGVGVRCYLKEIYRRQDQEKTQPQGSKGMTIRQNHSRQHRSKPGTSQSHRDGRQASGRPGGPTPSGRPGARRPGYQFDRELPMI